MNVRLLSVGSACLGPASRVLQGSDGDSGGVFDDFGEVLSLTFAPRKLSIFIKFPFKQASMENYGRALAGLRSLDSEAQLGVFGQHAKDRPELLRFPVKICLDLDLGLACDALGDATNSESGIVVWLEVVWSIEKT